MRFVEAPGVEFRPGTVLHVGAGGDPLPAWLQATSETRLDISDDHKPDVLASMTDIGEIGPFDLVYTCHALEHVYPAEAVIALSEFHRVLRPGGAAIVLVPDLEGITATDEVVYVSPSGPVSGFDMIYGHHLLVGPVPHMAHHCGFVRHTLERALKTAGFERVAVARDTTWNLIGVGLKAE